MTRFILGTLFCLFVAACGGTVSAPQQAQPLGLSTSGSSVNGQINAIRVGASRAPLTRNATLDAAAHAHASDMASRSFFGHEGSNGSTVGQRVSRAGYRWCTVAENISQGYSGGSAAVEGWRTSPGHYRNMVAAKNKEYGLANVGDVWVMVLAAKNC